jgi:acyl carrier protein
MAMSTIEDTVRQFILAQYLPGESAANLRNDTALQSSGILDSLGVLSLVSFLQTRYGVDLDVYDTAVERFDCIDQIAAVVARKRPAAASDGAAA